MPDLDSATAIHSTPAATEIHTQEVAENGTRSKESDNCMLYLFNTRARHAIFRD
jgi:hypothetical protein